MAEVPWVLNHSPLYLAIFDRAAIHFMSLVHSFWKSLRSSPECGCSDTHIKVSRSAVAEPGLGKKATRKKAGKKKASKKKRGKKKAAASRAGGSDSMARLMAAVEELREAVVELAQSKASDQQTAVHDLREAAKAKIADLEDAAIRSFKKLGF